MVIEAPAELMEPATAPFEPDERSHGRNGAMATIACGNCGGAHPSVAEVRACFRRGPHALVAHDDLPPDPGDEAPTDEGGAGWLDDGGLGEPPAGPARAGRQGRTVAPTPRRPSVSRPPGPPILRPADGWAGPDALGRGIVLPAGAEVPAAWAGAAVVAIDADRLDPGAVATVVEHWSARRRFVVELAGDLDAAVAHAAIEERHPWELEPGFTFEAERLAHLLREHAVDARAAGGARFGPAERAVALGAAPGARADVRLADGSEAFLDGGPLQPFSLDHAVVPTVALDHGALRALGDVTPTADLAPDQLAAVAHTGGAARIIAPAGSGKTRVLTERARHLLGGWGLAPGAVCLVAFNVRAAEEMRARTADLPRLHIRTLNSLGLAIANGSGPFLPRSDGRRLATIDEIEVRRILEKLVRFPRRAGTDPAAPWLEALAAVRLGLQDPVAVEEAFDGDVDGFADVLPRYRAELARRGAVDYDDQIAGAIERLLSDPAARGAAQRACRVLLVDEFQDLAPAHLLLVRLLCAPAFDCFGVGDDDQTIYGYVGADPDWLVRFPHWFPGASSHALTVNYRCAPGVVAAAANLLTRNARRVPKDIQARPGRLRTDGDLRVEHTADPAATTVAEVRRLTDLGTAPADIAVLTRVNVTLLPVQLGLAAVGVPTNAPVDTALLTRSGVRAALAWVQLATAPTHLAGGLVSDAARRPARSLSPRVLEWMGEQRDLAGLRRLAGRLTSPRDADKVEGFVTDVERLAALAGRGADTAELLTAVRDQLGLGAAMETLDRSRRDLDRSAHGDDLASMVAVAHLHPDAATFAGWLRTELERARSERTDAGVQLATVHKVKGREWPHVIVHDASEGLLPHRLATDREEERRVFHVGITRSSITTVVVADAAAPSSLLGELDAPGEPSRMVRSAGRPSAPVPIAAAPAMGTGDPSVAEALKTWRRERARRDGVPAYVVLPDKAVDDIARRTPTSLADLARCHGIGPTKLERYGDEILAAVDAGRGRG